jgi:hypothetical protein|nr:MAG TPA: hypothetical protein [Caudoviricetes sp.]
MKSKVQEIAKSKLNELKEAYAKGSNALVNAVFHDCLGFYYYASENTVYSGVEITFTYGRPSVYLNTLKGKLACQWGDDRHEIDLRHEAPNLLEAVDDIYEVIYEQGELQS